MNKSHFDYLDERCPSFFDALAERENKKSLLWENNGGIIVAHGDKCYEYKRKFEKAGLEFWQGIAIYLISYCSPYNKECRETEKGWVSPFDWVIANKDRFIDLLN